MKVNKQFSFDKTVICSDLGNGATLVIARGIPFIAQQLPLTTKYALFINTDGKSVELGLAESFDLAVEYFVTLDKNKLLEVA